MGTIQLLLAGILSMFALIYIAALMIKRKG